MKVKSTIAFVILLSIFGCTPSLLFTQQQFINVNSDASIPEKWHGKWSDDLNGDICYISRDSFSIGGLDYKINKAKMDFGQDSTFGKDKIIFKDDWCYFCRYVELDTTSLSGYQVLIANIDNNGNIKCWEMSYDYFLKNRLVNTIPTIKFITTNITSDGDYQKIEPRVVYAEIPEGLNKKEYNHLIKNTAIVTKEVPFFCNNAYDPDYFKQIAISRPPDLILTSEKKVVKRKENKNEIKYEKRANKNLKKKFLKVVTE
jgi:hypothetical protein